jgi:hypothetical protein
MSSSILASLLSKSQFTVANAATGAKTITGVKIKRVVMRYLATIPRHMREDGTCIVDTRIIRPSVMAVDVICPTLDDVTQLIALINDRENLYTITSKGIVFKNMMAQSSTNNQSPEMLSAAPYRVFFKELLQQGVDPVVCANAGDSDTVDGGFQIISAVSNTVNGLYNSVVNSSTGLFSGD